jgi:hypothetical protein
VGFALLRSVCRDVISTGGRSTDRIIDKIACYRSLQRQDDKLRSAVGHCDTWLTALGASSQHWKSKFLYISRGARPFGDLKW